MNFLYIFMGVFDLYTVCQVYIDCSKTGSFRAADTVI